MSTLTDQRDPTTDISKSDLKTNVLSSSGYLISSTPRFLSTLNETRTDISTNDLSTPRFLFTTVQHVTSDPLSTSSSYPLFKTSTSNKK